MNFPTDSSRNTISPYREIEERKRQQRLEQMRNGGLEEVKLLEQVIVDWDMAQKIKLFADSMEKAICQGNDEEKKQKIVIWIEWARNKADWLDPLVAKYDDLLGNNKHIFDRIIDENK